jgi:2-(1,2-epoxy-1,2-dihydrophenyl)acetyl-CoA isomerase
MINNPRKMNTMSANVNAGVLQALEMCADDKTVRVVVFTGAGDRAFCAGGNLEGGGASSGFRGQKGADKPPPTVRGAVRNLRHIATTSLILHNSHFVSVAAVNGACAGAGLSWACVRVSSSFFFLFLV